MRLTDDQRIELNAWINGMDDVTAHNLPLWINRRYRLGARTMRDGACWVIEANCPQVALNHAIMAFRHDQATREAMRRPS